MPHDDIPEGQQCEVLTCVRLATTYVSRYHQEGMWSVEDQRRFVCKPCSRVVRRVDWEFRFGPDTSSTSKTMCTDAERYKEHALGSMMADCHTCAMQQERE
jgi:hypothetical protein